MFQAAALGKLPMRHMGVSRTIRFSMDFSLCLTGMYVVRQLPQILASGKSTIKFKKTAAGKTFRGRPFLGVQNP
jgi:hypothetical protein